MAISITHTKTAAIPDFTQQQLDGEIARGNYPAGTQLADVVLSSDWNDDHTSQDLDYLEDNIRSSVIVDMDNDDYTMTDAEARAALRIIINAGDGTKVLTIPATAGSTVANETLVVTAYAGNVFYIEDEVEGTNVLINAPFLDIIGYVPASQPVSFFSNAVLQTAYGASWATGNAAPSQAALYNKITEMEDKFCVLSSDYNLTNTTNWQKCFNASTNGAFTVAANTAYFFTCQLLVTTTSATSGNFSFDILGAGTATVSSVAYSTIGRDGSVYTTASTTGGLYSDTVACGEVTSANTGTATWTKIEGFIRFSGAGTVIPSLSLSTANAAIMEQNSFIKLKYAGADTVTTSGDWS